MGEGVCAADRRENIITLIMSKPEKPAFPAVWERARELRKQPTVAEKTLWQAIRKKQLGGFSYRRQHVIHYFIVDFYCPQAKLAIEIDGDIHRFQAEYDKARQEYLTDHSYRMIRFDNHEVLNDLESVLSRLLDSCIEFSVKKSPPRPSP
jgi:very-short-patch-repair endonuclease